MSQISLKSISGITSITTPAGVDNQLTVHTNDTTEKLKVTTSGLNVTGVVTASSFVGDGSDLTGITQTAINNNANNRVITGSDSANTLEGEANMTFNGSILTLTPGPVAGNITSIVLGRTSSAPAVQTTAVVKGGGPISGVPGIIFGSTNTNLPCVALETPNSSNGHIVFKPKGTEMVRIDSSGRVGIGTTSPARDFHVEGTSRLKNIDVVGFSTFANATKFFHHTPRIEMQGSSTATLSFCNATSGTTTSDGMLMGFSSSSSVGFINVNESGHGFVLKTGGNGTHSGSKNRGYQQTRNTLRELVNDKMRKNFVGCIEQVLRQTAVHFIIGI